MKKGISFLVLQLTSLALFLVSCTLPSTEEAITPQNNAETKESPSLTSKPIPTLTIRNDVGYKGPTKAQIEQLTGENIAPGTNAATINSKILTLSNNGGGRIVFKSGIHRVSNIVLRDNIHVFLESGVEIIADQSSRVSNVFVIGTEFPVKNVTILGRGNNSKITYTRKSDPKTGARAVVIGRGVNVYIKGFLVQDNYSRFSGIAFVFQKRMVNENGRPENVTVENVEIRKASYGYGMVQLNTGKNVFIKNVRAVGGIAARIETDNRKNGARVGVDNILIKNAISTKGKAAVFFHPHDLKNGKVTVNGATANNSEWAVEIRPGRNGGSFAIGSSVKNIKANYGLTATVKNRHKANLPLCLLNLVTTNNPDPSADNVFTGPSITAVGNFANVGVTVDQNSISTGLYGPSNPNNKIESRAEIVKGNAKRGTNLPENQKCGSGAY